MPEKYRIIKIYRKTTYKDGSSSSGLCKYKIQKKYWFGWFTPFWFDWQTGGKCYNLDQTEQVLKCYLHNKDSKTKRVKEVEQEY